jgi:hypothetical protein
VSPPVAAVHEPKHEPEGHATPEPRRRVGLGPVRRRTVPSRGSLSSPQPLAIRRRTRERRKPDS